MIRLFHKDDLSQVLDLWLEVNVEVHDFIDSCYWSAHYTQVKAMMLEAEIYVWEENGVIKGFVGLIDNHIAGLFVKKAYRKHGIGHALLQYVLQNHSTLTLDVYAQNINAIGFYEREGFVKVKEYLEMETNQISYTMEY